MRSPEHDRFDPRDRSELLGERRRRFALFWRELFHTFETPRELARLSNSLGLPNCSLDLRQAHEIENTNKIGLKPAFEARKLVAGAGFEPATFRL
jgi:hypothetical protein